VRKLLSALGLGVLTLLASVSAGCGSDESDSSQRLPLPSFEVDSSLQPHQSAIAGVDDGPERALGAISSPSGGRADFVLRELTVISTDKAKVEALAKRWNGSIIKEVNTSALADGANGVPNVYLVSIDPSLADTDAMPEALQKIDRGARGAHRVSSTEALQTLAAAAAEAAVDPNAETWKVAANFLLEPSGIWEGKSTEHPTGEAGWSPNAYDAKYMKEYKVLQAWDALAAAGKLENRVKIMVLDGGFVPNPDFPAQASIKPDNQWQVKNPETCGGSPCPWHATNTVSAAMGRLDNGYGAAGPAGPIAELVAVQSPSWDIFQIINWLNTGVMPALGKGPRVINISATGTIPGIFGFAVKPLDLVISLARGRFLGVQIGQGSLVFAAAGNKGLDVDHEDCFLFCWESDVYAPCEADDAVCIGGTTWDNFATRYEKSNYGKQQRVDWQNFADPGRQDNSVDLYAPYSVWVGPTPDSEDKAQVKSGTSVASPFAAGIAALVWAANPTLSADQVYEILLESANSDVEKLRIDAHAAVKLALAKNGNNPPQIRVTSPLDGSTLPGGFQGITLTAEVKDFEDGPSGVSVEWASDLEGTIGSGTSFTHEFEQLGVHHVTATAKDKQGATTQVAIDFTVWDTPPVATILTPTANQAVVRGVPFLLQGEVVENFMHLPCSWASSSSTDTGFPLQSCTGPVTFNTNGFRTITLSGQDSYGNQGSAAVMITVVDPAPNSPPGVVISAPTPEQSFFIGNAVGLAGSAVDPDGKTPITYEWRFQGDACPQEVMIATGANASWDTAQAALAKVCGTQQAGYGTIRLYATDPDSTTGVASVHVYLAYNPN
jgi:serine protease